jgi:hypothetical protein
MSELAVPPVYNGRPTQYQLFDGFTRTGGFGKALYIVGFFISGPIIPAIFELAAYFDAQKTAKQAAWEISQQSAPIARSAGGYAPTIDMTPDLNAGTRFQDHAQQSRVLASQGVPTP